MPHYAVHASAKYSSYSLVHTSCKYISEALSNAVGLADIMKQFSQDAKAIECFSDKGVVNAV